jgi:imidazolonepropionase-like amidohydrolase
MPADLVIRAGTTMTASGECRQSVAIHEGRIVAVGRDDAMPPAREVIDATDRYVTWWQQPGTAGYLQLRKRAHTI